MFSKLLSIAPIAVVLLGQGFAALAQAPNSLYFIKYRDAQSGETEVHSVSGSSSYKTFTAHAVTPESPVDALNGKWTVEAGNAYFIKTIATGTNTIEVHRLSKGSNYGAWDIHSGSGFALSNANEGTWTIDGGDLYFIKTRNTRRGLIEVYRGNHNQGFAVDLNQASAFPWWNAFNATLTVRRGDLYLIKTGGTTSGRVEVNIATAASNYQATTRYETAFSVLDQTNGYWEINDAGDLYFVKTENVGSGTVEVHFVTKANGYQPFSGHFPTAFNPVDARRGTWIIDPVA